MKKSWGIFVVLLILIAVAGIYWHAKNNHLLQKPKIPHLKNQISEYFFPIYCTDLSNQKVPIISVDLEGLKFSAEIDLGFRGVLSLPPEILQQLNSKVPMTPTTKWGFRGKPHQVNRYKIPTLKIGKCVLNNIIAQENNLEFLLNAQIPEKGQEPHADSTARLGWQAFDLTNLFLDLGNSKIVLCDSLETLNKHGISTEKFINTPLFLDRGLVECFVVAANHEFRCSLDTGSTYNVWNNLSDEEFFFDPDNLFKVNSFKIERQEFGPLSFLSLPIKLPIPVDITLGMEFFLENKVFIDFSTQQVYFAPGDRHE